jgi:hypothetical protein
MTNPLQTKDISVREYLLKGKNSTTNLHLLSISELLILK